MGYDLGSVAWFTLAIKYPRKGCGWLSCEIQEWEVWLRVPGYGVPGLADFVGERASDTCSGVLC